MATSEKWYSSDRLFQTRHYTTCNYTISGGQSRSHSGSNFGRAQRERRHPFRQPQLWRSRPARRTQFLSAAERFSVSNVQVYNAISSVASADSCAAFVQPVQSVLLGRHRERCVLSESRQRFLSRKRPQQPAEQFAQQRARFSVSRFARIAHD